MTSKIVVYLGERNNKGVRRQASGVRRQASGVRDKLINLSPARRPKPLIIL
jgi:hypothetical protein